MPSLTEGGLTFHFPDDWDVSKLDDWSFYRKQFQRVCGGTKAVDIIATEPDRTCVWLIEIKDYRVHVRQKPSHVADETAYKVRDSLALLATATIKANLDEERARATRALRSRSIRVILHLEQPAKPSRLFPRKIDLALAQQQLRQRVRAIDPHALVREMRSMHGCGWSVQ